MRSDEVQYAPHLAILDLELNRENTLDSDDNDKPETNPRKRK